MDGKVGWMNDGGGGISWRGRQERGKEEGERNKKCIVVMSFIL